MQNNYLSAIVVVLLLGLLASLLDPFMVLMPPPLAMTCLLLAAVLVAVFAGFVVTENATDEREALHRLQSGRMAYLAGIAVLTVALLAQGFVDHHIDPWIALALAAMIVVKLGARFYTDARN